MAFVHLDRITIYPIKSLDGVDVPEAQVLANGALENDRRFTLLDAEGRFVNGKRTAAVHRIRAEFNLAQMRVRLNGTTEFSLLHEQAELCQWFSTALSFACVFAENAAGGFPDDTDAPGPTVISTATLQTVTSWFPSLTLDESRRRFRANLEIAPVRAFWEDHYVAPKGAESGSKIVVDGIEWLGVSVCQRCVVPSRATDSGETTPLFQKRFAEKRQQSLPRWSPRDRFDHFYRLAINTRLAPGSSTGRIAVGSPIKLSLSETLL